MLGISSYFVDIAVSVYRILETMDTFLDLVDDNTHGQPGTGGREEAVPRVPELPFDAVNVVTQRVFEFALLQRLPQFGRIVNNRFFYFFSAVINPYIFFIYISFHFNLTESKLGKFFEKIIRCVLDEPLSIRFLD